MPPLTYRITTLGCRVNHAEAREIESILASRGLVPAPRATPAHLELVHTCTVTHTAAAKSRHAVRRALRRSAATHRRPGEVVVTGCYATTNRDEAAALTGDTRRVLPHEDADGSTLAVRVARRVDEWLGHRRCDDASATADAPPTRLVPLPVVPPAGDDPAARHVRAELRIQDGCDAHCTFCIIPKIRRTLRSKRVSDAVDEATRLVARGHREIVLAGIFIGAYGHETALRRKQVNRSADPLADLLDAVARVPGLERLRISSMEPGDVSDVLLDAMVANAPTIVPHLHLPLQSGSDRVLRMMNRQYGRTEYLEMIDRVNAALTVDALPPAITTDMICGFPGETDADFALTRDVAERVGYLHMHVFPYSARVGTSAARWHDRAVTPAVRKRRVRDLITLETDAEEGLSIRYRRRLEGRRVRVILEQPDRDEPGLMTGRCDHYALIHLPTDLPRGRILEVDVTSATPERTLGTPYGRAAVALPVLAGDAFDTPR